ncbi:hypothetical protein CMU20_11005 [Elizabethkingia anophelis]|nr:hypothetical protein [Elizabethkingia anophelis]
MKNSNFKILSVIFSSLLLFSCSNGGDNFEAPEASFTGRIISTATGKPVPGQEPNGARIRMYEGGKYNGKVPIDFWVTQSGAFVNKTLFSGTYKVIAEGPFQRADTLALNLASSSSHDFSVTPFLELNVEIVQKKENAVVVKYKIDQSPEKRKILRRAVLVSNRPYVDITNFINSSPSPFINTAGIPDSELAGKEFVTEITGLSKGVQYYVRSASRCDNPNSFYNYSEIIPFTL